MLCSALLAGTAASVDEGLLATCQGREVSAARQIDNFRNPENENTVAASSGEDDRNMLDEQGDDTMTGTEITSGIAGEGGKVSVHGNGVDDMVDGGSNGAEAAGNYRMPKQDADGSPGNSKIASGDDEIQIVKVKTEPRPEHGRIAEDPNLHQLEPTVFVDVSLASDPDVFVSSLHLQAHLTESEDGRRTVWPSLRLLKEDIKVFKDDAINCPEYPGNALCQRE
jgi:hypothetical protein